MINWHWNFISLANINFSSYFCERIIFSRWYNYTSYYLSILYVYCYYFLYYIFCLYRIFPTYQDLDYCLFNENTNAYTICHNIDLPTASDRPKNSWQLIRGDVHDLEALFQVCDKLSYNGLLWIHANRQDPILRISILWIVIEFYCSHVMK